MALERFPDGVAGGRGSCRAGLVRARLLPSRAARLGRSLALPYRYSDPGTALVLPLSGVENPASDPIPPVYCSRSGNETAKRGWHMNRFRLATSAMLVGVVLAAGCAGPCGG